MLPYIFHLSDRCCLTLLRLKYLLLIICALLHIVVVGQGIRFENRGVGTLAVLSGLCRGIRELDIGFYRKGLKKISLGIFFAFLIKGCYMYCPK